MAEQNEKIVALYVRVSTGYQVDKDSLPFQKKELKAYCEHVLHIDKNRIEIFEDAGKSGKNTKRPAFERMMGKVKSGQVSHVIVYKIDRISRNLVDFSLMYDDFKYNNVTFISLNEQFDTSSAIGEAILKIILVFAELERKLTSERVTDVMKKNNVLCIPRKKLSTPLLCMKCILMEVQRFQFEITITHITFQPSAVANGHLRLLLTS